MRPLRIGRASGSCRLTSRVAPSGICPASRDRAWATTTAVRPMVTDSSPSARRRRPRIRPLRARRTARRPLRSTAAACAATASARSARSPVTRPIAGLPSSRPSRARARIVAAISRARRVAARRRPVITVPVAPPAACTRRAARTSLPTARASSPASVGKTTFAAITVVSARTRAVRSSLAPAALTSSASFSPATAPSPHRVVNFISVVGCGTVASSGIRQNRRQEIESLTSAHKLS